MKRWRDRWVSRIFGENQTPRPENAPWGGPEEMLATKILAMEAKIGYFEHRIKEFSEELDRMHRRIDHLDTRIYELSATKPV